MRSSHEQQHFRHVIYHIKVQNHTGFLFCLLAVSSCLGKCEVRLRAMLTPDNTSEGWQLYAKV